MLVMPAQCDYEADYRPPVWALRIIILTAELVLPSAIIGLTEVYCYLVQADSLPRLGNGKGTLYKIHLHCY